MRGVEIRIHISALLSLPLAYYLFQPRTPREYLFALAWLLAFAVFVLLHELAHAFAARLLGVEVKSVTLWLLGGFTALDGRPEKPLHHLAIAAAGPLANLLLAFLCMAAYIAAQFWLNAQSFSVVQAFLFAQTVSDALFSFALFNLLLAFFNLLPLYPLDGGVILQALTEEIFGKTAANWVVALVGAPILLGLLALVLYLRDYVSLAVIALCALGLAALNPRFSRRLYAAAAYLTRRGVYYYLQEDFDRAVQFFTEEIEREPQCLDNYLLRAACLVHLTQTERCKADVERALKLDPNYALALLMRGELFMMEKDFHRALELFDRVLSLSPNLAVARFDRGSALMDLNQYAAALQEFNDAIQHAPRHPLFFLLRSTAYFRLGDLASARKDQDKALKLDLKDALVMADFNMSLYENFFDWAEDYYGRTIASRPKLAYAFWGRGDAYRVNRLYEEALCDYNRAIELAPGEAKLYLRRGDCLLALNRPQSAAADFQTAAQRAEKPHLKRQAAEALKRLENSQIP